jgi:uroporphyrinogen decarboxylase
MTDQTWQLLLKVINGEKVNPLPLGFYYRQSRLPGWRTASTFLDYYSNDELWLKANLKAVREIPGGIFFAGILGEWCVCAPSRRLSGALCALGKMNFHSPSVIHTLMI